MRIDPHHKTILKWIILDLSSNPSGKALSYALESALSGIALSHLATIDLRALVCACRSALPTGCEFEVSMEATPSARSLADNFAEYIAEVKLVHKAAFHRDLAERVVGYHH